MIERHPIRAFLPHHRGIAWITVPASTRRTLSPGVHIR